MPATLHLPSTAASPPSWPVPGMEQAQWAAPLPPTFATGPTLRPLPL